MGYTTEFTSRVNITPPLNPQEIAYLIAFANTRHNKRKGGPYAVSMDAHGPDVINDRDHDGKPGYWCNWVPTADGAGIEWNGVEKFYDADAWMQYLVDHFLMPGGHAQGRPEFEQFTFDHAVSGVIHAQGEDPADRWELIVEDNKVSRRDLSSPSPASPSDGGHGATVTFAPVHDDDHTTPILVMIVDQADAARVLDRLGYSDPTGTADAHDVLDRIAKALEVYDDMELYLLRRVAKECRRTGRDLTWN